MPSWSERLKTKRFRPEAELSVSACWGQSPNPNDRRFHIRRRTWRRLFFFLLVLSLRRTSDIFNAEQSGQIGLISQQLPVLIFRPVVFRVCRLFHRQQFGVLRPERFQGGKLLLVGTGGFAGSVRGKQFVKCQLECFAELNRILMFFVVRLGITGRPITGIPKRRSTRFRRSIRTALTWRGNICAALMC